MATTLEQISQEKQRIGQRLTKLQSEYDEIEAAERVFKRYGNTDGSVRPRGRPRAAAKSGASATNTATKSTTKTPKAKQAEIGGPTLGVRVLQAVSAASTSGIPKTDLLVKVKGKPNHIGMAIARHLRAGRMIERDGKICLAGQEQARAAA